MNASIVLYNNSTPVLKEAVDSVLRSLDINRLILIDNSPTDVLKKAFIDQRIEYVFNPSNPGFGAAHNIALLRSIRLGAKYHLILNPDVKFSEGVIASLVNYMDEHADVGMIMPQILNTDLSIQNLPKLLPSPFSVIMRKLKRPAVLYKNFINKYELRFVDREKIYEAPVLSGCFTLLRMEAVKEIGMYDDRFFMYFEDWDLSRRMHQKFRTVYFPEVSVIHAYESGANKNIFLFKIFVNSAIKYFNKWGWFFDSDREKINKEALSQF